MQRVTRGMVIGKYATSPQWGYLIPLIRNLNGMTSPEKGKRLTYVLTEVEAKSG